MKRPSAFLSLVQRYSALFTWVAIFTVFYLTASVHQTHEAAVWITLFAVVPMVIVWAFIYYHLAPRTLHSHRGVFYLSCAIILVIISTLTTETDIIFFKDLHERGILRLSPRMEAAMQQGESQRAFLHTKYIILLLTTMAVSTVSWLLDERKRINRMQREHRAKLELKYLRAQMNPHFLFNALNCIYSLTLTQDEKAPDSVMKLSEMLRYVTDDCQSEQVPLQKEVAYISNFIDFQRIRMEKEPDVTFDVQMQNPAAKIPPMLFQPMVENSFKHSRIVDQPDGYIRLSLHQDEQKITFTAENSKPQLEPISEDQERTGIGLQNVQQRLNILFKDKATLHVDETDTKYRIEICIMS